MRDALAAAQPGALDELARWAALPADGGGGAPLRAVAPDLAVWDRLRAGIRQALEAFTADRARALAAAGPTGDLDVGAGAATPDSYRALVERYYRAIAERSPAPQPQEPR